MSRVRQAHPTGLLSSPLNATSPLWSSLKAHHECIMTYIIYFIHDWKKRMAEVSEIDLSKLHNYISNICIHALSADTVHILYM
uniref:Uncharacterized protein n=1 Tax=Picea glauca TaxID=3330 RepID=A0A101M0U1_PICGL|nr:hypothetical protein ABT39_MTgene4178 [Picea glauca]